VQDVVPFTIADGNPARARGINQVGLQRNGRGEEQIKALRAAFKTLYRSKLNITQALEALRSSSPGEDLQHLIDFVASSQRGIVTAGREES
jgi:UDP-N-acetylglucosamine acyltransferase